MNSRRTIFTLMLMSLLVLACSEDGTTPTETEESPDQYLRNLPSWQEFSPPLADEEGETGLTQAEMEIVDDQPLVCRTTPCSITATPEAIVTFNPNSEILYLGSLIQGDTYLAGLASMEELPIRQRAPLIVSLDLQFPDNMRTVDDPNLATVGQAIGDLVTVAHNAGHHAGSALTYSEETCYSLDQSMLSMGVSAHYMGASARAELEFNQTSRQTTIMAYFKQRMFTASMVLPQTPGEFFSAEFTREHLDEQIELDRIGPDKLPVYVSSIVYGRIMMMTMTSDYSAQEMRSALEASYNQGLFGGEIEIEHQQVLESENTTFNLVAVGGEASHALEAIRTGNLNDYFNSDAALTSASPLSYTLRNLGDNSIAQVSETTTYDRAECSAEIVEYYDDYDQWRTAVLGLGNCGACNQAFDAEGIVQADEVNTTPGNNVNLANELTFPGASSGHPLDFTITCLTSNFTYNDTEFSSGYFPMLSVGDVDNGENDDFEIAISGVHPDSLVLAMGIFVGDNQREAGEGLKIYGEDDILIGEFGSSLMPHSGSYVFVGVVSGLPMTRFRFEEHHGGDDICITNPQFGLVKNWRR